MKLPRLKNYIHIYNNTSVPAKNSFQNGKFNSNKNMQIKTSLTPSLPFIGVLDSSGPGFG